MAETSRTAPIVRLEPVGGRSKKVKKVKIGTATIASDGTVTAVMNGKTRVLGFKLSPHDILSSDLEIVASDPVLRALKIIQ